MQILNPTAPPPQALADLRRSLDSLSGKTIGFIDNAKPNFHLLVDDIAELLVKRHGVSAVVKRAKRGASMPASPEVIDELARECDLVITGSGD
jgi:hypothetical protein